MSKYRKRPVEVEAIRWSGANTNDVLSFGGVDVAYTDWVNGVNAPYIRVQTLEGTVYASKGDWIVKGIKGEFYPVRNDIFGATYEAVEDRKPRTPNTGKPSL